MDNAKWKITYRTISIDLYPWIIIKNECCIDELRELLESLCMQNTVRKFINPLNTDLILTSEDMVIKELINTDSYIRPEYLYQQVMEFTNLPKGIMLLQMGEGFGKTLLTTALDDNGLNRIKIPDCITRAYYINDAYASNVDYFISNMYDLFRTDQDGKVLYRGNLPMLSKHDENPSQKMCELLTFYRQKCGHSKLLFILDGIDEIVPDGEFTILNFIPEDAEILEDLFVRDYKPQELLGMCERWIDYFYASKQKFSSDDLKAIIDMVICSEEEFVLKGLYKKAIKLLEKTCEIKEFNNEFDEIYAFLIKKMGLCYVKDNNLTDGDICYEKSIKVYDEIMKNNKLENGNEFVMLCANKGIVNLHQQKFQDAYDAFHLGLEVSNKELKRGMEIDKEVNSLIVKNITMLINYREEANIVIY